VSLIAHCTQSCPAIRIEGFHLHHFYYGIGLALVSTIALTFVTDARTRWDVALILGIGSGLIVDEVGLVVLGVQYWDLASLIPILALGLAMGLRLAFSIHLRGVSDFRILDRSDGLTILSVLLGVTGFLYFVRPIRVVVETVALGAWATSLVLMGVYGRKHLLNIRRGTFLTVE